MSVKFNEENLKKVLTGLSDAFEKQTINEFDDNFPKVRGWIEKYIKNKPFDIANHFNSVRLDLKIGSKQFFPELKFGENKKINIVINGIYDGSFIDALELKCENYTDMVRKFFKAVYKTLTTNEAVNVYEEYTLEEITDYYNNSQWEQEHSTLEKVIERYVGKPKLSLKDFKTSLDIIDWFYHVKQIQRNVCQVDFNVFANFKPEVYKGEQ